MIEIDDNDWDAIRHAYEARVMTVAQILDHYKISRPVLYQHAQREGWVLRRSLLSISRHALNGRIAHMLERQIAYLEMNMTGSDEKEVALLGNMARTLEKLIDLDKKSEPNKPEKRDSREIEKLRQKLADRIDQLQKE